MTNLKSEIDTKLSSFTEKFDTIQSQLNEVLLANLNRTAELPKPPVMETETDETWWDNFKQSPTKVMKETVAPMLNDFKEKAKSEVMGEANRKAEMARYDTLTLQQYPQLNDPTHPLFKEYQLVMQEKRKRYGDWDNRPESVYDSAQIAFARLVSKGEIIPDAFVDEAKRMVSVGDSMIPGYTSPTNVKPVNQLNKSQSIWASKLGITPEKYTKHILRQ